MLSAKPNRAEDEVAYEEAIYNEAPGETPVPAFGYCMSRGRRPTQEDRISCNTRVNGINNLAFFGIYDGHLGDRCSEMVRTTLPEKVSGMIGKGKMEPQQLETVLTDAFKKTDSEFCKQANANGWEDGSTACTVLISGTDLICANAGDSKAILCRLGKPLPLSKEHKPHVPAESARVKAAGGTVAIIEGVSRINGNLSTSRSFGDAAMKQFIIPDPAFVTRKLSRGDEFIIVATDGLWDYVDPAKALSVCQSSGNAKKAASQLVDAALANGSFDNIGVLVIDLRSFWSNQVDTQGKDLDFNLAQKSRKFGEDIVARTDFYAIEPEACGWLYKESSGGIMGRRWQKRWFLMHSVRTENHDGSVHNKKGNQSQWALSVFVLHYHDTEEKAKSTNPRKAQFVDPSVGASREEHLDMPNVYVLSLYEISNGEPILLAAETQRDAEMWVRKLNQAFQSRGYTPGANSGVLVGQKSSRTLSQIEATNPNVARTQTGSMMTMPNGTTIRTRSGNMAATGPLQLMRTETGGMRAVGSDWSISAEEMAQRDMIAMGIPRPGYMLSSAQAKGLGVPEGSVLIR
mmetsp:Transcript_5749/g.14571  ORF Transcript_5749/g.14571 Transcript_5749/m.14571 type:complete len:573 (+) Transcript_5749:195-1913(+)